MNIKKLGKLPKKKANYLLSIEAIEMVKKCAEAHCGLTQSYIVELGIRKVIQEKWYL